MNEPYRLLRYEHVEASVCVCGECGFLRKKEPHLWNFISLQLAFFFHLHSFVFINNINTHTHTHMLKKPVRVNKIVLIYKYFHVRK